MQLLCYFLRLIFYHINLIGLLNTWLISKSVNGCDWFIHKFYTKHVNRTEIKLFYMVQIFTIEQKMSHLFSVINSKHKSALRIKVGFKLTEFKSIFYIFDFIVLWKVYIKLNRKQHNLSRYFIISYRGDKFF